MFVGFIIMSENMVNEDIGKATSLMFGLDSFCICVSAIYFKLISKDWRGLLILPLILQVISMIALANQHESPKFYFATGQFDNAREVLTSIGRTNGVLNGPYSKKFSVELKGTSE